MKHRNKVKPFIDNNIIEKKLSNLSAFNAYSTIESTNNNAIVFTL